MLNRFSKLLKAAMAKFSISRENVRYTKYYKNIGVIKNTLLIDDCKSISDNPELLKELCNNPDYKALKKYMVISDRTPKLNNDIKTVRRNSKQHLKLLAQAEFIISDCLDNFYIKKDAQCYICTADGDDFSKIQRNCIIASFIYCKNKNELNDIRQRYMLDNLLYNTSYAVCDNILSVLNSVLSTKDNSVEFITGNFYNNGKENVLIFTGALEKNGITTALKNLLNALGDDKNYIPFFYEKSVLPNAAGIDDLGGKNYISICGDMAMTLKEILVLGLYYLNINIFPGTEKMLDDIFKREIKRCFGDIKIDYAVHFTGYARNVLQLICRLNAKKFVWVHNNLFLEAKTKGNIHISTLKYGYSKCDKIVVVRDTMKDELTEYVEPEQKNKIQVVHNLNDSVGIRKKAELPIEFQQDTYCNVPIEKLKEILEKNDINKFINIARFSKEKGIDRLISAFNKYRCQYDKNAYLIIIGGYGEEFDNILAMLQDDSGNVITPNIIIIKSIINPFPILKKCNLFVLSSHYEGLPMTIIEALILNIPVISTDITGPREFLGAGYGHLVDNSEQGIIDGLKAFKNNDLSDLAKFDVDSFNENAIKEFNALFE